VKELTAEIRSVNELKSEDEVDAALGSALEMTDNGRFLAGDILMGAHERVCAAGNAQGATDRAISIQWNLYLSERAKTHQRSLSVLSQYMRVSRDIPVEERSAGGAVRPWSVLRLALGKDTAEREWIYDECSFRPIDSVRQEMSDKKTKEENPEAVTLDDITEAILQLLLGDQHKPYEKYY